VINNKSSIYIYILPFEFMFMQIRIEEKGGKVGKTKNERKSGNRKYL
jgi:hypothetical protein